MFGLDVDALPRAPFGLFAIQTPPSYLLETLLAASKAHRGLVHEQSRLISWPRSVQTARIPQTTVDGFQCWVGRDV